MCNNPFSLDTIQTLTTYLLHRKPHTPRIPHTPLMTIVLHQTLLIIKQIVAINYSLETLRDTFMSAEKNYHIKASACGVLNRLKPTTYMYARLIYRSRLCDWRCHKNRLTLRITGNPLTSCNLQYFYLKYYNESLLNITILMLY